MANAFRAHKPDACEAPIEMTRVDFRAQPGRVSLVAPRFGDVRLLPVRQQFNSLADYRLDGAFTSISPAARSPDCLRHFGH